MAMINDWVAEIIVLILLASIIDLLIPNHVYKKYVQLVIGLIILLIFLKPLFYFFNYDIVQNIQLSWASLQENAEQNEYVKKDMKQKEIQSGQDAYILKHMTEQLIQIAKYPLIDQHELEISHIDYEFTDEVVSYESLETLFVYVIPFLMEGGEVEQIEQINIQNEVKEETEKPFNEKEVIKLLKELWEFEHTKVNVIWEGA
ncbi:MAG TPA: stage III sporulation protein AF [Bacillota bacterium]|nr:stage III sporulation protein AF [Bacillota bacterium]